MVKKVDVDLEKLKFLYLEQKLDVIKCARELNTSPQTVTRRLKKLNIPIRNSHPVKVIEISKENLYNEFVTNHLERVQIAEKYGITANRVSELLFLHDISFRDRKHFPTKEELYQKYKMEHITLQKLCKVFNIEYFEIQDLMKKYDIPFNRHYKSLDKEALTDLLLIQNKSITEVAEILGCSTSHVNKHIKKYNIHKTKEQCNETRARRCMEKYGVTNAGGLPHVQEKIYASKKKNHTMGSSKPEDDAYKLLVDKYGEVKRQYRSKEYPFACDFYIPVLKLYIEYQGDWSHGGAPFDASNSEHQEVLAKWLDGFNNGHPRYMQCIKTWTQRDPLKRETAKKNNLNWIEFFTFDKFEEWLQSY